MIAERSMGRRTIRCDVTISSKTSVIDRTKPVPLQCRGKERSLSESNPWQRIALL